MPLVNREEYLAYAKQYRAKNGHKRRAYFREYRRKNADRLKSLAILKDGGIKIDVKKRFSEPLGPEMAVIERGRLDRRAQSIKSFLNI